MARHNLFLGKARGKIGDVVLSQLDGKQVARARNRNPKNPKTNKQMYQRAIMASVMQMYSAGKMIFDHSFEGKTVKFGAMRRFMSVNAKKLRADILADLANNTSNARVVHPGAVTPCPYAFRVSEGQYGEGNFGLYSLQNGLPIIGCTLVTENAVYVDEVYNSGDIYTVVLLYVDGSFTGQSSLISPPTQFGFMRMKVKENLPHLELGSIRYNEAFDIETYNLGNISLYTSGTMDDGFLPANLVPTGCTAAAVAVIRSAEDSGLRSTADFVCATGMDWGISADHILDVWNADVKSLGDSDLILEGGSLDGGPTTSGGGGGGGGGVSISGRTTQNATLKSGVSGTISGNPAAVAQMSDNTTRPVVNNATDKVLMRHNGTMYISMELTTAGDPPVSVELALSHTTWENSQFVTVAQMQAAGF